MEEGEKSRKREKGGVRGGWRSEEGGEGADLPANTPPPHRHPLRSEFRRTRASWPAPCWEKTTGCLEFGNPCLPHFLDTLQSQEKGPEAWRAWAGCHGWVTLAGPFPSLACVLTCALGGQGQESGAGVRGMD